MNPLLLAPPLLALLSPPGPGGELALALDSVRAESIAADLYFFADDEMRGRDTPSPELAIAARFLRARLEHLGVPPGAGEGYFHEYDLLSRSIDPKRSHLVAKGFEGQEHFVFGQDYFFYSTRDLVDMTTEGGVVFAGTGERDQLEKVDLSGSWALCIDEGMPANRRRRNVQKAGAAGLLVVPRSGVDEYGERFANTTEFAIRGVSSLAPTEEKKRRDPIFPQAFLSREAGVRLLAASGARGTADPAGWTPAVGTELDVTVVEERRGGGRVPVENVCALWPGSDPELADEVIVVSAHYDHVGARDGKVWNGADDNGSGSMGLLAVAEALTRYGPARRSVMLIWVSGEEKGLWGSKAWTEDPLLPEGARAICNVNIDMIGRNEADYLLITPSPEHEEYSGLSRLAHAAAREEGFSNVGSADPWWARSDHMNFSRNLDIPVCFFFSDEHEDYHQPTDDPDKIDYDKIRRVARTVVRLIDALQADELDI